MKILVSVGIIFLTSSSLIGQKITHKNVLENGDYQTMFVAKELSNKEQVNQAHIALKQIPGVVDVNFIYPESKKFTLRYTELFDVKVMIAELKSNGIELTTESINFDAK